MVETVHGNTRIFWNGKVANLNWLIDMGKAALLRKHPILDQDGELDSDLDDEEEAAP